MKQPPRAHGPPPLRRPRPSRAVTASAAALAFAATTALVLPSVGCRRQDPKSTSVPAVTTGTPLAEAPVVVRARGQVWREARGGRQAMSPGIVGEDDVLSTGPDGNAVVRIAGGREIELKPNARLRLKKSAGGQLVIEVDRGAIISRTSLPPSATTALNATGSAAQTVDLTILTPFGVTRIPGQPSEAAINIGDQKMRIEVAMGQIVFTDRGGRELVAQADETIEVTVGGVQLLGPGEESDAPGGVRAISGEGLDIVLSAEAGTLLVRRPGEKDFTARRAVPAAAGTAYKVANPGGQARIVGAGLRGQLGPGTRGAIGEAVRIPDTGVHRYNVAVDAGTATLMLERHGQQELALGHGAGGEIAVRATEPATMTITAGRRGKTISVLAGSVEVLGGGTTRTVDAGSVATVDGRRLTVAAHPQSDVILPTARGLRVHADLLTEVTLSWPQHLEGAVVAVGTTPDLKEPLLVGRAPGGSVTLPAPRRGDLFWRVIGKSRGVERVLTGQARFVPDRRRSVLDLEHPHNLVSENGQVTTVHFQSVLPALTFTFPARPGARRYRVRVYRAGQLTSPVVEREVTETRCPVDAEALQEGRYVWHAQALDPRGRELGGGRMNKLDIVYDNSLTTLAIGSPKPGERVIGEEVDVTGVAPLGSKLFINGKLAPLDEKGRFSTQVARADAVVFRLVRKDGAESYWIRRLRTRS